MPSFDFTKEVEIVGKQRLKTTAHGIAAQIAVNFLKALHAVYPHAKNKSVLGEFISTIQAQHPPTNTTHREVQRILRYVTGDPELKEPPAILTSPSRIMRKGRPLVKIYNAAQALLNDSPNFYDSLTENDIDIKLTDDEDPSLSLYQDSETLPQRAFDPAHDKDQQVLFSSGEFQKWLQKFYKRLSFFDNVYQRLLPNRSLHHVHHNHGRRHAGRCGKEDYSGALRTVYLTTTLQRVIGITTAQDEHTIRTALATAFMGVLRLEFKTDPAQDPAPDELVTDTNPAFPFEPPY